MATLTPADAAEVREAIQWAAATESSLALTGGASKQGRGRPVQTSHRLALDRIDGVVDYQPSELVLTARAGTSLAAIGALLVQHGQHLAFEPPDTTALLGPGRATLGGTVACNLSGPRRVRSGAARDHVLGIAAVTGRGEAIKAGGKVVKNVTGYDLPKLMTGSFGTLAALTEISVKVLPRPEKTRTVLVFGLDASAASQAMAGAMSGPLEPSAVAYLPAAVAARSKIDYVAGRAVLALRLEGPERSTLARTAAARAAFGPAVEELHGRNSGVLWNEIGFAALLAEPAERPVWRLIIPPSAAADVLVALESRGWAAYLDWAGGLACAAVEAGLADAGAGVVRALARRSGGMANLVRAPAELRGAVDVFEPLPEALAALTRRVKEAFDPKGILEPGRMFAGV